MDDLQVTADSAQENDFQENVRFKEQHGISKLAFFQVILSIISGIILILLASFLKSPIPFIFLRLIRILGVLFSTPIFYLFFDVYQYFIPPLYSDISDEA